MHHIHPFTHTFIHIHPITHTFIHWWRQKGVGVPRGFSIVLYMCHTRSHHTVNICVNMYVFILRATDRSSRGRRDPLHLAPWWSGCTCTNEKLQLVEVHIYFATYLHSDGEKTRTRHWLWTWGHPSAASFLSQGLTSPLEACGLPCTERTPLFWCWNQQTLKYRHGRLIENTAQIL